MRGHVERIPISSEISPAQRGDWGSLVLALVLSFLYCAFLAVGGVAGLDTLTAATVWVEFCAGYWALFAVLQVWWWRKGCGNFWRPVYAWSLFLFICFSLFFLPVLLVPRFRRWLFRKMKPTGSGDPLNVLDAVERWWLGGPMLLLLLALLSPLGATG